LPIRRYVLEFTAGRLDFIVPANPAWGEGASTVPILFSDPIMQSRAGLIGLTPGIDPTRIKTITTLAGYTIAFLSAPNHPLKNAQVNFVNDVNGAMKVLASKRTDVIYLHYDAAREWIRTNSQIKTGMNSKPLVKFHFYDQYSEEFDYCLASIRHPAIIDAFNRWLRKHPGVLEEIRASMQASPDH
jgi:ABC-type amino acid transport substrate-binding protein